MTSKIQVNLLETVHKYRSSGLRLLQHVLEVLLTHAFRLQPGLDGLLQVRAEPGLVSNRKAVT